MLPSRVWESDLLTQWRERILMALCLTGAVVGLIPLVTSLILSYREGLWLLIGLDIGAYGATVLILAARNAPLKYRVGLALLVFYLLGVILLVDLGAFGAGYIWLFGASVMAAAMLGLRAAVLSLFLNLATLMGIGVLIVFGIPEWAGRMENAAAVWLIMITNFMLVNALVTLATAMILSGLQKTLKKEQEITENLRRSEERFRLIVDTLPVLIIGYDNNAAISLWNAECERSTGYLAEEVYHTPAAALIHDPPPSENGGNEWPVDDGYPHEEEKLFKRRDGSTMTVSWVDLSNVVTPPGLSGWAAGIDISQRKAAERELRENSLKYRMIFDKATEGIMVIQDGVFKFYNRKAVELLGYSLEEAPRIRSISFLDWVHPEDRRLVSERYIRRQMGEAIPTEYQIRVLPKNGSPLWVQISSTVIIWENKAATLTFMNDIMERKRAEDLLRESERRFKEMANMLPTIIVEIDVDGRITYSNQAGYDVFKYSRKDAVEGAMLTDFIIEDDLPKVRGIFNQAVQHGIASSGFECRLFNKLNKEVDCLAQIRPMFFNGSIKGVRASLMDVTDIKRTERNLEASQEKHRNILDSIQEGYYEVDLSGNFIFFNKALHGMLGFSAEELAGMNYQQIMDPETAEEAFRLFLRVFKTGEPSSAVDWSVVRKDGERRNIETSLSLIKDLRGETTGFRGVARDVTERKRFQEAEEKRFGAEAANQAKSDFLARMSHEIRTPINAVIGMTELALDDELNERQKKILETISSEALALINLVNRILDFSKIEARKMELEYIPFQLDYLLEDISDSMAVEAHKKDLEFILYMAPGVPTRLLGDPGRVRQVLINLLGNAVKFTHQGEIYLKVEKLEQAENRVKLRFSIKDTGIGIPEEKQKTIFDAFTQADGSTTRHYGGTGLGATISKRIAEMMGGEIGMTSREGAGSTFTFSAFFGFQPEFQHDQGVPDSELAGKRVLVVDDNATYRSVLTSYLQDWGCEVEEAGSMEDALEILKEWDHADDNAAVILSDLQLSDRSGIDLAAAVKSNPRLEKLPIIVLADLGGLGDGLRCREIGIDGYLTKPVRKNDLQRIIRVVLGLAEGENICGESILVTKHFVSEMDRSGMRVLLVEDYPTNQIIASEHLHNVGCRVELAANGREAVDAFQRRRFDLILMDIQMPVMDGYEATRRIREIETRMAEFSEGENSGVRIPIIAMTAHAFSGYREKCLKAGMDDYITKPLLREDLLAMIQRWSFIQGGTDEPADDQVEVTEDPLAEFLTLYDETEELPMDLEAVVDEFMGKRDLVKEVAGRFIKDLRAQIEVIRRAIDDGRLEVIRAEAHSIKGGAANLTAQRLSKAAAELEQEARSGHTKVILKVVGTLETEADELEKYLRDEGVTV